MITQINIEQLEELAVFPLIEDRVFSSIEDFLDKDPKKWTGIDYTVWTKLQGKKTERVFWYTDESGTDINSIKSIYVYTFEPDTWEISSYERFIQYLKPDGSVGLEKRIKTETGFGKITKLNREIKFGVIDDLRERGKNLRDTSTLVPEPYKTFYTNIADATDQILSYFYKTIHEDCIDFTWDPWIDEINNIPQYEEDGITPIDIWTDINTPANADGSATVKDFIFAEIVTNSALWA